MPRDIYPVGSPQRPPGLMPQGASNQAPIQQQQIQQQQIQPQQIQPQQNYLKQVQDAYGNTESFNPIGSQLQRFGGDMIEHKNQGGMDHIDTFTQWGRKQLQRFKDRNKKPTEEENFNRYMSEIDKMNFEFGEISQSKKDEIKREMDAFINKDINVGTDTTRSADAYGDASRLVLDMLNGSDPTNSQGNPVYRAIPEEFRTHYFKVLQHVAENQQIAIQNDPLLTEEEKQGMGKKLYNQASKNLIKILGIDDAQYINKGTARLYALNPEKYLYRRDFNPRLSIQEQLRREEEETKRFMQLSSENSQYIPPKAVIAHLKVAKLNKKYLETKNKEREISNEMALLNPNNAQEANRIRILQAERQAIMTGRNKVDVKEIEDAIHERNKILRDNDKKMRPVWADLKAVEEAKQRKQEEEAFMTEEGKAKGSQTEYEKMYNEYYKPPRKPNSEYVHTFSPLLHEEEESQEITDAQMNEKLRGLGYEEKKYEGFADKFPTFNFDRRTIKGSHEPEELRTDLLPAGTNASELIQARQSYERELGRLKTRPMGGVHREGTSHQLITSRRHRLTPLTLTPQGHATKRGVFTDEYKKYDEEALKNEGQEKTEERLRTLTPMIKFPKTKIERNGYNNIVRDREGVMYVRTPMGMLRVSEEGNKDLTGEYKNRVEDIQKMLNSGNSYDVRKAYKIYTRLHPRDKGFSPKISDDEIQAMIGAYRTALKNATTIPEFNRIRQEFPSNLNSQLSQEQKNKINKTANHKLELLRRVLT